MLKKNKQASITNINKSKYLDFFDFFLIGDENVGKTCLLNRYCNDYYSSYKKKKRKPEIFTISTLNNLLEYKVQFWDVQFTLDNIESYYLKLLKKSDGIIFVCSFDSKESLNNILNWYKALEKYDDLNKKQKILFVNKNDLEDGIQISDQDINQLCKELKIPNYKMSAKTGNGVKKGFAEFIHRAITKIYNYDINKATEIKQGNKNQDPNEKCFIL